MYAVINHLHLSKPVEDLRAPLEQEGLPLLAAQPGFENFYFVKTAEDRATVILVWKDATSAQNGAQVFGPTWFAANVAPYLASEQQRSGGEILVMSAL